MIVTVVQMNSTIGDFAANAAKIVDKAVRAASPEEGLTAPDLVVFPELALCGYPPMDLLDQDSFVEGSLAALRSVQKALASGPASSMAVAVGHVDRNRTGSGRSLVNAISVIKGGKIVFSQAKTLLPTYDVFDEARYFEPAKTRALFDTGKGKVGFPICEDLWWEAPPSPGFRYAVDPVKELLDAGAELLVVPSASPFVAGKLATRLSLAAGAAKEGGIPVIYCNAAGANDSLVFDGRSFAVDATGALIRMCGWDEEVLRIDTDSAGRASAADIAISSDADGRMEEIHRALVTGIRDYMAKSGFRTALLGLSGGIDSALVAILAAGA
ncbi:MAG: nitrilase-related carbon-nitrogen hydrolase, partial [Rectinema sp.]